MLLMVLVSMYATFAMSFSLGKIAGVLLGVGVFYALVGWASSSRRAAWAVAAYVLFGLPLAILGLLGINWTNKLPALSQLSAHLPSIVKGLPGAESGLQPNEVGGALVWIVPVQLSLLGWSLARKSASRKARWILPIGLLLLTAMCTGTLVLTQSRSALIGFALGMGLLLWLGMPKVRLAFVLLLVLAAATAIFLGPQTIANKLVDRAGPEGNPTEGITSLQDRTEIWSRAIYGIEDFPFTGMGMNAFRRVMPILYPMFSVAPETDLAHAHNELLQAALDLGLPGLIAYMAIMLLATALLVQTWQSATEGWVRAAVAGIAAGLLAHFVYGITDAIALGAKPGVLLWWLLGLSVVLWQTTVVYDTQIRADEQAQEGRERDEMQLVTA
jgi:putative inorganic carbon (HCO3(-)) transporter